MDRFRLVPVWILVALGCAAVCAPLAGCGMVAVLAHAVMPNDIPAKFKGLEEKRVVVVCRPVVELKYSGARVPQELAQSVSQRLAKRVKKIKLVDDSEVEEWTDENDWHNFAEVGKAMKADIVVGIDLEQFQLHQGPTLLQGEAMLSVVVIDVHDGSKTVFSAQFPSKFPPHTPIPTSERTEQQFRHQFVQVLAEQVSRNFYPHDSRADFAGDADLSRP
jgi:hypothetical protein